jgi:hypothetical protein
MKKKPSHLKKIDPKEIVFFNFKLDSSTYVLYDSDMGEPVSYGSFALVGATIKNLSPECTIYYFEMSALQGWKLKRTYKPDNTVAEEADKKENIESKKQETQEDKSKK